MILLATPAQDACDKLMFTRLYAVERLLKAAINVERILAFTAQAGFFSAQPVTCCQKTGRSSMATAPTL